MDRLELRSVQRCSIQSFTYFTWINIQSRSVPPANSTWSSPTTLHTTLPQSAPKSHLYLPQFVYGNISVTWDALVWSMQADVKYFYVRVGQNLRLFYLRVQDLISYPSCIIGETSNPNCNRRIVLTI